MRTAPFPSWPVWDERDEQALLAVLRSGTWGAHAGTRVTEFGQRFAAYQQAEHAVCVTNGTAALEVALRAVGVGPLDEVIIPPYTFVATATAVLAIGAIPVFCDILPDTYLIDAADAERRITPRTRAIVAVHIAGQPADLDAVGDVARRHGLKVVEDAAQAHGAAWRGRRVGAIGDAGSFSFQSSKNLNAGEGGIILTDDREVAERAWSLANVGRIPDGAWYQHEGMGFNLRLTEFQGALLLSQLERLPEQFERRERNARFLDRGAVRDPRDHAPGAGRARHRPRPPPVRPALRRRRLRRARPGVVPARPAGRGRALLGRLHHPPVPDERRDRRAAQVGGDRQRRRPAGGRAGVPRSGGPARDRAGLRRGGRVADPERAAGGRSGHGADRRGGGQDRRRRRHNPAPWPRSAPCPAAPSRPLHRLGLREVALLAPPPSSWP